MNFTAIDFETACHDRASICQIGLVRIERGLVAEELNILVQPPQNYYDPKFSDIHGITQKNTENKRYFRDVWPCIEPYIRDQTVVAHNMAFDASCLLAALQHSMIGPIEFEAKCTYQIYRKSLKALCKEYDIALHHHFAWSDAKACAQLYLISEGARLSLNCKK